MDGGGSRANIRRTLAFLGLVFGLGAGLAEAGLAG